MGKADSNRTGLAYVIEADAWGFMPASAATPLTDLRFTGESFSYNIANIQSAEIRSDRQVTDLIQTGSDCSGGFNFELSYGAFDSFLMAALWSSAWSTAIRSQRTDLTFDATNGRIFSEWSSFASFDTGQWIYITGFVGTPENNIPYYITGRRTTGIDVTPLPPTAVASTDTNVLWVRGAYVRNGVTETSFSIEREHADITQFFDFKGMVVNSMTLSAVANSILTGSFDFIGKESTIAAASGNAGTNNSAATADVFNAVANVGHIMEGATLATIDSGLFIQEISFTVNNNVRGLDAIGTLGNVDLGVGTFEITGTLNAYFQDATLYTKYVGSLETGIAFKVEDNDGNAYMFTFPRVKFETDAINAPGQNTDVMENITWRGIRDPATDCMMQIDRFPA